MILSHTMGCYIVCALDLWRHWSKWDFGSHASIVGGPLLNHKNDEELRVWLRCISLMKRVDLSGEKICPGSRITLEKSTTLFMSHAQIDRDGKINIFGSINPDFTWVLNQQVTRLCTVHLNQTWHQMEYVGKVDDKRTTPPPFPSAPKLKKTGP